MTLFTATSNITYGGSVTEKQDALALDFLKDGKAIDWVLSNVCGKDNKALARVICLAQSYNFISMDERKSLLAGFKIDEAGRRTK